MQNIAVYAGSFDPFTNGHLSIVKSASDLFDHVYVVIAQNANKHRNIDAQKMCEAMKEVFGNKGFLNCTVLLLPNILVADYCKELDAKYLVRGLRNTSDYMYEENIAKINWEINPELKTIYFRADNEVISSSMVRELLSYGKNIDRYIPTEILKLLKSGTSWFSCRYPFAQKIDINASNLYVEII